MEVGVGGNKRVGELGERGVGKQADRKEGRKEGMAHFGLAVWM